MAAKRKKIVYTTFPAFSFDKVMFFHKIRTEKGYSAFECSFMIGKNNFLIRDAENPLKKTLIDAEDSLVLAKLFRLERYNPPCNPIDYYKLDVTFSIVERKKMQWEIVIANDEIKPLRALKIIEEDKEIELPTSSFLSTYDAVQEYFKKLVAEGYFNSARTALDILNKYRESVEFGPDFHPRYLIKNIRYYLNKKSGEPILFDRRTNQFSRRLYFKPFNFEILSSNGLISKTFLSAGINTFQEASNWVSNLPYRRNHDKENELALFKDLCGTCSTKHALLKRLADENGKHGLKLILGLFKMGGNNTPAIKELLQEHDLPYIPEAHNYLRVSNYIMDFTGIGINETKFELDILKEIEIQADQITDFKVQYHREYLAQWIEDYKIPYSLDELWSIREECIGLIGNVKQ
ncbi:hypothetical protein SF1_38860 [Sphingobacterium faecium NBRC 15299]|uniref:hypothetical protein n=1 Tax=Sphingobacterium faecium TaxID=34087 RepID=UPI000D443A43|nr:hypothetical protein [Sphingobacterium faecium]PTX07549.1 hypothetical protein C8N37_11158 [Sphingobacterium faecium]GEM65904.1 hypothetical protein SF1_38860 [Sphingobacterium faecium NBRC 15299]